MKTMLMLGATSDIARAVAHRFAREGWGLILVGREAANLERLGRDLVVRYQVTVETITFDALDYARHEACWANLPRRPEAVFCALGYLGRQEVGEADFDEARKIIETNYLALVSLLHLAAREFEDRRSGLIIGVSSVAGDRGRQSNYIYGSAKAGFSAFLSGLRNRLNKAQVHVLTVKPGFVNTSMTAGMKLPAALTAQPEEVAEDIWQAVRKKKNVVYTKWFWRYIMAIIIHLPEVLFKRMKL